MNALSADALATIVRLISDAVVTVDEAHHIVYVNDAGLAMFGGYSREELLGRPLDVLLPDSARAAHGAHVAAFNQEVGAARLMGDRRAIRGQRRDGTTFAAEASIVKFGPPDARVFTAILRDVTVRARSDELVRTLAEAGAVLAGSLDFDDTLVRVCRLATSSLADLVILDLREDGGKMRRVAVAHADPKKASLADALSRFPLDRSRPHLPGTVLENGEPVLVESVQDEHIEGLSQGDAHLALLRELAPTSYMAVPLIVRQRVIGAMVFVSTRPQLHYTVHDVAVATELARRASVAVDNAQLYRSSVRATAARDEVLAAVAHDLRNPLAGIGMAAKLLLSTVDPRVAQAAERIGTAVSRMNGLISDLLEVARLESGQVRVECGVVRVESLVGDALAAVAGDAERRHIRVLSELHPGLPEVDVEARRVVQVLVNLVGNAVKFADEGGCVAVRTQAAGTSVEFAVADDGPGIPKAHLPHIFDRFWQGRPAGAAGAGLGLAIARGIVEAHGGRIWVESVEGQGATFRFTLPVAGSSARSVSRVAG